MNTKSATILCVFLILFALTILACGDLNLISNDVISDVASCYQSVEATDDSYIVSLEKDCIDFELSGIGGTPSTQPWELITTLERHPIEYDKFYVPDASIDVIIGSFAAGDDFLFVIAGENYIRHEQFYFRQPEPPRSHPPLHTWHYPSISTWYRFWGNPHFEDRTHAGFTANMDLTSDFNGERDYFFAPEFGTSLDGVFVGGPGAPHIKDGIVLKIYVR